MSPSLCAAVEASDAPQEPVQVAPQRPAAAPVPIDRGASGLSSQQLESILDGRSAFSFHFQPIVDLAQGLTVGFEALARFSVAESRLAPNLVFEAADLFGRRFDLEELVMREAITSREKLPKNCFLTVNVGPNFALSDRFDRLLSEFDSLAGVIVEITEDEAITDYRAIHTKLELIRAKGALAAVDDAGSGYASLQHIIEIRPDFVKLDRSFVRGCCTDPAKAVLIEMLGKAASRLDAWLIAEGVETAPELEELIRVKVPLAQGFYLGRPDANMRPLDEARSRSIRATARAFANSARLDRSVEAALTCLSRADAEFRLADQPLSTMAVTLNPSGQPVDVFEKHPHLGVRKVPQFMKVQIKSEAGEILHRALTRPSSLRYDPLVVINELGQLQGVIHLDRLMRESLPG